MFEMLHRIFGRVKKIFQLHVHTLQGSVRMRASRAWSLST